MKELADLLHLITCPKPHPTDVTSILSRDEDLCYYYLEADIAEGQTMPDHILWRSKVERFKIEMAFTTDEQAIHFIREILKLSHHLYELIEGNKGRRKFIITILNLD